jgi:hypothetical protein
MLDKIATELDKTTMDVEKNCDICRMELLRMSDETKMNVG